MGHPDPNFGWASSLIVSNLESSGDSCQVHCANSCFISWSSLSVFGLNTLLDPFLLLDVARRSEYELWIYEKIWSFCGIVFVSCQPSITNYRINARSSLFLVVIFFPWICAGKFIFWARFVICSKKYCWLTKRLSLFHYLLPVIFFPWIWFLDTMLIFYRFPGNWVWVIQLF